MPVTFVDRLPLPNLKVYTATTVLLISMAIYYALSVTSDPNWKMNSTMQKQQEDMMQGDGVNLDSLMTMQLSKMVHDNTAPQNESRDINTQFVDVISFMLQEPQCMWAMANVVYCCLALLAAGVQRSVFGELRASERQHLQDKLWNYVFYKFIFVFGVLNVQYMEEVLLWCSWFTVLGFLQLLALLCKQRFEYLSFSPSRVSWTHAALGTLLAGVVLAASGLLALATVVALPAGLDTFAFMATECILLLLSSLQTCSRAALFTHEARLSAAHHARAPLAYYTQLGFDTAILVVELVSHVHMLVWSNMLVSLASVVLVMQLRHLFHELRARLRRHRHYRWVLAHMDLNYPMASQEEVAAHHDNCAICWEQMESARRLPCNHLFHNWCLSEWLQLDASCPTCRRPLPTPAPAPSSAHSNDMNHFFHFDGSRYVSWLPSFSVEVVRVRREASELAAARQLQTLFPQYPLPVLAADLAATRAPHLTLDNILEGRLPLPESVEAIAEIASTSAASSPLPASLASLAGPSTRAAQPPLASVPELRNSQDVAVGTDYGTDLGNVSARFSKNSAEREAMLSERKERLLMNARKKYLEKLAIQKSSEEERTVKENS